MNNKQHKAINTSKLEEEIKALRNVNEVLKENTRYYRCLADAASKAIFFFKNGICLEANRAAADMFGFEDSAELLGKNAEDLITPDSYHLIRNSLSKASSDTHKAIGIRKGGISFPIAIQTKVPYPLVDNAVVFSIEDITQKNRLEKINQTLFAISNAVNITLDLNDLYKQIHRLLSEIIDVTNFFIAIVNNENHTIHFPYYVDTEDADFSTVMEFDLYNSLTGLVVLQKKPLFLNHKALEKRRSKKESWGPKSFIWMGVPLMIKDEVIGVIVVQSYTDPNLYNKQDLQILTSVSDQVAIAIDRKRSEDSLRESERRYRQLFNNAPAGIFEINLTNQEFINVNQVMCSYFGYSEEEFQSMRPIDLLTKESKVLFRKGYKDVLKGKKKIADNVEYNAIKKNGEIVIVLLNSDYVYEEGEPTSARVVVHDITERKKIEEMMIQSEKMMSIGGLAAGMAHEINNPLAGMMQSSQLILSRLTKDLPANDEAAEELGTSMSVIKKFMEKRDILKNLKNINRAGARAAKIIGNMLSFAKKGDSTRSTYMLYEIIDKTIEIAQNEYDLKKKFDFKQIKITREYDPDISAVVCGESKIQQVLFNLIKNAAESMHSEARNNKSPELIFRLHQKEKMVCIEIEDNGPGMDTATRKRIFEPFFTTKSVDQGTGLGLSVSYFIIVDDHNGEMKVESMPGKGTKFIIKLPVN